MQQVRPHPGAKSRPPEVADRETTPRLRIQDLRTHGRGPFTLGVEPGACVALFGDSGAGKSLLLRAIADLDPHEGRVWLDGEACESIPAPEWRRRVGLLPTESQWWGATVGEHLRDVEIDALRDLGFEADVLEWPISRLSSGERQRLAVLRLLSHRPAVLLLDEPTANLDERNGARVERRVNDHREQTRAAVVWVTHGAEQAARVASRRLRVEPTGLEPDR